ncbi:MAG: 16S rRNA processing protein RimM [Bacteroidales bacterium]|nr:16S rRNA processing protein RimM [Bacteroidales bacterium]
MEIEGHYYLGKILKPIGLDGHLLMFLDVDDASNYQNLDAIFASIGGNLIPFLIEEINLRPGKQAQVKFQDIDSIDQTDLLTGASVYLPIAALPGLGENQFYYHEIIGFNVIDKNFGELGEIEKVLDYPLQALLQVMHGDKEILIPVADEIISKVDKQQRVIHIDAPEGLIEMYLE